MTCVWPRLCYAVSDLAEKRGLSAHKLQEGLGLQYMAIADHHDDPATLAANAIRRLMEQNDLQPADIGRLYVASESHFDAARPLGSYIIEMMAADHRLSPHPGAWSHCDHYDALFACVSGVDQLENALYWISQEEGRRAIVVCSDIAKYPLQGNGEYTQGAGAVAMLVGSRPRLLQIPLRFGSASQPVRDFYKPVEPLSKQQVVQDVLDAAGVADADGRRILDHLMQHKNGYAPAWQDGQQFFHLHGHMPEFDGPLSIRSYRELMMKAMSRFSVQLPRQEDDVLSTRWSHLAFHLPYARHGERVFTHAFAMDHPHVAAESAGQPLPRRDHYEEEAAYQQALESVLKRVRNSAAYLYYVREKIQPGQIVSSRTGNMYTASLFVSLMSILEHTQSAPEKMLRRPIGMIGYGSGAKAKVFEGHLAPGWQHVVGRFRLLQQLRERQSIDFLTYEALHRGKRRQSVQRPSGMYVRLNQYQQPAQYGWEDA